MKKMEKLPLERGNSTRLHAATPMADTTPEAVARSSSVGH